MSELNNTSSKGVMRWQLLASVSASALLMSLSAMNEGNASDSNSNRPTVWIELGGGLSRLSDEQAAFVPPFIPNPLPPFEVVTPGLVEKPAPSSWDGSAKITLQPPGMDWKFSAAIIYGRTSRSRYLNQITQYPNQPHYGGFFAYQTIKSRNSEGHTIIDFQVGRDVGLGMGVRSTLNFGVRYVHFGATTDIRIQSQPTNANGYGQYYYRNYGHFSADRKFNGVGPSLSWDASVTIVGNADDGQIAVDWGVDGALLFGRQTVRGHHQSTTAHYVHFYPTVDAPNRYSVAVKRNKQVTVPNVGGFAGVSWRYPNAKVTLGYRADYFFGAMDGGVDARRTKDVGFYGPFANVSIGLGG